jgi:hypothetical protein
MAAKPDEADQMLESMKALAKKWHAKVKEPDLKRQLEAGIVKLAPLVEDLLKMFPEDGAEGAPTEEKTVDKCGGEGGTPGPCPDPAAAAGPVGKKGKVGPAEAAQAVLGQAKAGNLSLSQLEAFSTIIRKLPERALRKIGEIVGIDPGDAGDLRLAISDRLNDVRGQAIRERKTKPAEGKPAAGDVKQQASRIADAFDKLDREGTGRNFVSLVKLRQAMPDLSKEEFDAAINHLRRSGGFTASAAEGRHGMTQEELAAAIRDPLEGGKDQVMLYLSRREKGRRGRGR